MNLNTTYLDLRLRSPLVVSASPLSKSIDNVKRMEDAGAGAVVLFSLFEEQIRIEQRILNFMKERPTVTLQDVQALFPPTLQFHTDVDHYLAHIRKCKESVRIPIIASVNCASLGVWADYTHQIEQSGADALELNIYPMPTDMDTTAAQIEAMCCSILKLVKETVKIPVAIKLPPFFTNLAEIAGQLDRGGADALVLFNRFLQPDLDPVTLQFRSDIPLGTPNDLRLTLHWIAILSGYIKADLGATGGVYTAEDVVKLLMTGAKVTMLASALLKDGIDYLVTLEQDLQVWLEQNEYESVGALQGILRQFHSEDTSDLERRQYIRTVTSDEEDTRQRS